MGSWGVPLARILYYIALIPAQLRKSGVVMDRHATLWLSEACGGMRLGACGRCVAARCAGGERQRSNRRTLSTLSTRDGSLTLAPWCLVLGCHRLRLGGDGTSCVAGQPATASGVADYLAFGHHLSQSASGSDAFPCNPFNPCS